MFEQNDNALFTAQKIIKIFCIIGALMSFIGGMILCITCNQEVVSGFNEIQTVTNYNQIIGGIILMLLGSFAFLIIWIFSKLIFSAFCDIKLIRNKLYESSNDNLKSFIENDEDIEDDNDKTSENKKKTFLEKFKEL